MSEWMLTARQRRRLEHQLTQTHDARVYRRTLGILEVARGKSVAQVARSLGVSRESVYNWFDAYETRHDPRDLQDDPRSGRPSLWNDRTETILKGLLGQSPDTLGYYAVNWTVPLLQQQLQEGTGVHISDDTIRRELRRLGYVWKRGRYQLAPDPELEKKTPNPLADTESAAPQRPAG